MTTRNQSNESGIAMIIALFMMLALSVVGASLITVAQTETNSSHNYRLMSQARYGAESAVHKTTNYLLNTYVPPGTPGNAADPIAAYTTTVSPVTWNNLPVVLSSNAAASNYPVDAVKTAFAAASQGTLNVNAETVSFTTTATLKSMRQITDMFSGVPVTIQTWELSGDGNVTGARTAQVEVATVLERQTSPIFGFAAFATDNGCGALNFAGGATTNSYDSKAALVGGVPVLSDTMGNVGTNGNLDGNGSPTKINGTLSSPRTGVGNCTAGNVTAETAAAAGIVQDGLNQLSQPLNYPDPAAINPLPPTTGTDFKKTTGCPAGVSYCTASADGATFTPPSPSTVVTMGDVAINAGAVLHLHAGIYVVNSFIQNGNASMVVDDGPVIIKVAGVGYESGTAIQINGGGIVNPSFKPSDLEFIYGGTGEIKLNGGDQSAGLFYAPHATAKINGGADLYGSIIVHDLNESGGASIHYDRNLQTNAMAPGNFMMSAFTWKSF